jgi:hypothetical protein
VWTPRGHRDGSGDDCDTLNFDQPFQRREARQRDRGACRKAFLEVLLPSGKTGR